MTKAKQLIRSIGYATRPAESFCFDSPYEAYPGVLITCFQTPFQILTVNGMETGSAGDCVINTPPFHRKHRCIPGSGGYSNDWLFIDEEVILPEIRRLALPENMLIHTGDPMLIRNDTKTIAEALDAEDEFTDEIIRNTLKSIVFHIRQGYLRYQRQTGSLTPAERYHYPDFLRLRNRMNEECSCVFTVEDMAAEVNMSRARMSVLYKKFFGEAPYDSLLRMRMERACALCCQTDQGVKEIAMFCGISDMRYFTRLFKQRFGSSPTVFRKNQKKSGEQA